MSWRGTLVSLVGEPPDSWNATGRPNTTGKGGSLLGKRDTIHHNTVNRSAPICVALLSPNNSWLTTDPRHKVADKTFEQRLHSQSPSWGYNFTVHNIYKTHFMIIYTYTKTELVLVNIIFLKHNHSLHHSEVKDLNLCYLRRPSPWVAKGDACAERHVLAWGEGRGLCPPRCRDDPKWQNEMFPLGLYQINASHALLSTMRLSEACQNMTSWHGENISGGKGQVSVLTWLPWPGTWYLDSLQKMEDLVR